MKFDDTFVEVSDEKPPVFPGLFLEIEEWMPAERAQMMVTSVPEQA
jgi:hypothetical protein